jgi:hypothetical protein
MRGNDGQVSRLSVRQPHNFIDGISNLDYTA